MRRCVPVRLDEHVIAQLSLLADREHRTLAETIREILGQHVAQAEQKALTSCGIAAGDIYFPYRATDA